MKTDTDGSTRVLWKQPSGLGETGPREGASPRRRCCLALLMLVGLTASALAAETPSRPPKTEPVPSAGEQAADSPAKPAAEQEATPFAPLPPAPATLRDPTQPSEQMKAILGQQRAMHTSAPPAKLPSLRIKGRVASSDGDVLVLLQVGQELERVTADTEWTTEDGLTITVVSVSLTELRLQIQPHNRTVTIR